LAIPNSITKTISFNGIEIEIILSFTLGASKTFPITLDYTQLKNNLKLTFDGTNFTGTPS
jgi:hypothetical protein